MLTSLADAAALGDGDVLVTHMTSPDWLPLLRRAAAVVTDSGGMTCHAAIVSRELGIPCVVGTGEATTKLRDGEIVTVDATRGVVLEGARADTGDVAKGGVPGAAPASASAGAGPAAAPVTATQILVNLSEPSQVARVKDLPVDGVGLLRAELMVLEALAGDHPRTLLEEGRGDEFVARMAEGLSTFAAGFAPRPVTYRTIDFRTNEFSGLRGGERFEPHESNPMIGYRGALRYTREPDVFALELAALRQVWDTGLHNLHVMLPFVRSTRELRRCRELIAESGLLDRPGFELWVMAEVPSVLFNLAAVRGARRHRDLGRLERPHAAAAGRRPRQRGAGRDLRRARSGSHRIPARADPPRARARAAHLDLRPGSLGASRVRGAAACGAGIDAISVSVDAVDRTRRLVAAAEQRLLLDAARSRGVGMFEVRIHGRGGQGVVTAAEMLSLAAFDEGRYAQAFPSFGSERMGAPVVAFCRIDDREIRTREPVMEPDALIVQDPTLLHQVDVFGGCKPDGFILINTAKSFDELGLGEFVAGFHRQRLLTVPASELAREHTGRAVANAALLGGFAALSGLISLDALSRAIRERFAGVVAEGNVAAATAAHAWVAGELQELGSATPA